MLYKNTVSTRTLELLKEIYSHKELKDFYLAGGTGLALQLGHRKSIDLDLFTTKDFDADYLLQFPEEEFNLTHYESTCNILSKKI